MANQINVPPASGSGSSGGLDPNVASCLTYLCGWLTGLIFFLIEKENKTVRFHALHAIAIDVATIAIWLLLFVMSIVMAFIPFIGPLVMMVLWLAFGGGLLVLRIVNMIKAYQGAHLNLPFITDWVKGQIDK